MYKIYATFIVMSLSGALFAECKLQKPISFNGNLLETRYLTDIKTDSIPKFLNPTSYNPARDTLAMLIFEVKSNGSPSRLGGAKMGIEKKPAVIGFSNEYHGPTRLEGGFEEDQPERIKSYWSQVLTNYADGSGEAVNSLRLSVKDKKIVAIEFTHPVFEIVGTDGPYTYTQFSGENQTICILSAKIDTLKTNL